MGARVGYELVTLASLGMSKRGGLVWIAPFPRLRFRLRRGFWCSHPDMGPWELIDLGRRKMRRCPDCDHAEVTP